MERPWIRLLVIIIVALALTGCAGTNAAKTGIGAVTSDTSSLSADELSAVEASLVATRLAVAQAAPMVTASVLPDVAASTTQTTAVAPGGVPWPAPPFEARGHEFRGGRDGNGWLVQRGEHGCPVRLEDNGSAPPRLWVASVPCVVERTASGGMRLTRPDGEIVTVDAPVYGVTSGDVTTNGVVWHYTWGTDTLLTLQSSTDGRVLTVVEDDAGQLLISRPAGPPHRAQWNAAGSLEGDFAGAGGHFRFRGGRFEP